VQAVTEWPGFVTGEDLFGLRKLLLDPHQKLRRGEALWGLGRAAVHYAHDDIVVCVNIKTQFNCLCLGGERLRTGTFDFGGFGFFRRRSGLLVLSRLNIPMSSLRPCSRSRWSSSASLERASLTDWRLLFSAARFGRLVVSSAGSALIQENLTAMHTAFAIRPAFLLKAREKPMSEKAYSAALRLFCDWEYSAANPIRSLLQNTDDLKPS